MKWTYKFTMEDHLYYLQADDYTVGQHLLVLHCYDVNSGDEYYNLVAGCVAEEGYPLNMNREIKRFHGWIGATDGVSRYAEGVYQVKSIEKSVWGEDIKIILDKKDIKKGFD